MNRLRFDNVAKWCLSIQALKSTGSWGRFVNFNQLGWRKYCTVAQLALSTLPKPKPKEPQE